MIFAIKYPERVGDLILNGANTNPKGVKRRFQIPIEIGYRVAKLFSGKSESAKKNAEMLGLMVLEPDVTERDLASVRARTLVIAGTRDMIRPENTRFIAGSIPDSRLVFIEGNHFIAKNSSEEFNRAVLDFLAGASSA